jgi:hypothetical protein
MPELAILPMEPVLAWPIQDAAGPGRVNPHRLSAAVPLACYVPAARAKRIEPQTGSECQRDQLHASHVSCAFRRNILIDAEQIAWVVFSLDRLQPSIVGAVRRLHARRAFFHHEVDICSRR